MTDLSGRICVVTGANRGIGHAVAAGLAARGATVGLVCRTAEKAETARAALAAQAGRADLHLFAADLSVQAEVRRVAGEILARFPAIHVLVNNAGLFRSRRSLTPDGIETTLATNHLAPFLLTHLLLDAVKAGAPSRIVTVASRAHRNGHIAFDDLEGSHRYSGVRAYAQSKLANVLFTRELARRLEGTGVVAHAVHPGVVATGIWESVPVARAITPLLPWIMRSPAQGAESTLHAVLSEAAGSVTGRYYVGRAEAPTTSEAADPAAARRLWEASERLVGLAPAAAAA